jgi:ribosomal protein S18 acetylase RimI-like enzyme
MEQGVETIIRPFDGSFADAEGLLAVERATLEESPYSPQRVQAMLVDGPQRAWLAVAEDRVVGFLIGFVTNGLPGVRWEIDLLAVHPDWMGQGLAKQLIGAAAAYGAGLAHRARAVVAVDNIASRRAFERVGFRLADRCKLLIYRPKERPPAPWSALDVEIHDTADLVEAVDWLPDLAPVEVAGPPGPTLLLARQKGQPVGYAELVAVETLLYRGVWIESLSASTTVVRSALIHRALAWAAAADLDEVGAMVPEDDRSWQEALRVAGFRSLGDFWWLVAHLPISPILEHASV